MTRRPYVLIVEDDADLRTLIEALVGLLEVDTATAENGAVALAAIELRRPDLVLLDMKMPVMDGWQFCRVLAERNGGPIPIIVMTAAADPAERAAEVNAQAWIGKPFDTDELLARVKAFLPKA
jgi:CheY-like chemotaxis protein